MTNLQIFGCDAFMLTRQERRNKLDAMSIKASSVDTVKKVKWAIGYGYPSLKHLYAARMLSLVRVNFSNLVMSLTRKLDWSIASQPSVMIMCPRWN